MMYLKQVYNKKILLTSAILLLFSISAIWLYQNNIKDRWVCKNGEWIRQGSPKTSQPKEECKGKRLTPKLPSSPPESTVMIFYDWAIKQNDILLNKSYKKSDLLTDKFKQRIEKNSGNAADIPNPIYCSNEEFKQIVINNHTLKNTQATVNAELKSESETKKVSIILEAVDSKWKISDIKCPQN